MPCGYHINSEAGLVTITGTQTTTTAQLQNVAESLLQDRDFDPKLAQLIDFRGLDIGYRKEDSERIHNFTVNIYGPQVEANIAIVMDGHQHPKAIAGMYRLTCAMRKTELFDDYDQALRWLMRREFV